ncbi:hypothetical protein KAR91_62095 [Candidatus Pacearchaeota archaeon]|nr:hypothetical protein [Candidatus Pacearchaeota archaeon]
MSKHLNKRLLCRTISNCLECDHHFETAAWEVICMYGLPAGTHWQDGKSLGGASERGGMPIPADCPLPVSH